MKIAVIGDLHLGYRQYGLDVREMDFYEQWQKIVDDVIGRHVDMVLQLGDIFDTHIPSSMALYQYQCGLDKLDSADIRYLSIMGNHTSIKKKGFMTPDTLFDEISSSILINDNFHIIDDVFVAGIGYRSESDKEELLNIINVQAEAARRHDGVRILMLHQAIDVDLPYGAELSEEDLPCEDFDYIFVGHLHSRISRMHGDCHIIYPGSIERCSADEAKEAVRHGKGYCVLDTELGECEFVDILFDRRFIFEHIVSEDDFEDIGGFLLKCGCPPIVDLTFSNQFDMDDVHDLIQSISDDCLRLNVNVLNDSVDDEVPQSLNVKSFSSIKEMLDERLSAERSAFAYDLIQVLNKAGSRSDNVESCIQLCDDFFEREF